MSGRSRSYKEGLLRRLKDNTEAVNYLQAALEDSQSAFLVALKNVLDSRKVAAVARASKLNRVHIYQMLTEDGNPTLSSLEKILRAIGLRLEIGLDDQKRRSSSRKLQMIRAAVLAGEQSGIAEGDVISEVGKRIRRRALDGKTIVRRHATSAP
jgi:probable addiction module antidote protein